METVQAKEGVYVRAGDRCPPSPAADPLVTARGYLNAEMISHDRPRDLILRIDHSLDFSQVLVISLSCHAVGMVGMRVSCPYRRSHNGT